MHRGGKTLADCGGIFTHDGVENNEETIWTWGCEGKRQL